MNELIHKDHFLQMMAATEVAPAALKTELNVQSYGKLPLSQLAALGVGFEPVVSAIQQITNHGHAVSGYYKVKREPISQNFKMGAASLGQLWRMRRIALAHKLA